MSTAPTATLSDIEAARIGHRQLGAVLAVWTLLLLAVALGSIEIRLSYYRDQVDTSGKARLAAVQETLSISFRQWEALPANLARRRAVRDFVASIETEQAGIDAAAWRDGYARYAGLPAVQAMNEELAAVGDDFALPFVALISAAGQVLAGAFVNGGREAGQLDLSSREYVRRALAEGRGSQFVTGRVSGVPGMYFASRIERDGRTIGVAAVKQDAAVINRMLADTAGHLIAITDPNGVVVLGNREDWQLRRLADAQDPGEAIAQDLYRRQPEPLDWKSDAVRHRDRSLPATRVDGLRHLLHSAPLAGQPLTVWLLSPLADEAAIRNRFFIGIGSIWLIGAVLLAYAWRRMHWLQLAMGAQRDAHALAQARRVSDDRFAAVYEHAATAYCFFTARGGIDQCNPAAVRMFGAASEAELRGLHLWQPPLSAAFQADGRPSGEAALADLLEHRRTRERINSGSWRFRRRDGREFDAEFAVIALEWEQPARFCAVLQDVTVRRETEAALHAAKASAEAASRAKTAFLANMSHELRTPMNAIIGMTHLALDGELPAASRAYVDKAHRAARSLLQIVDDVLDMSKIEAGQLVLERIDFDLESVVSEMADVLGLRADEKGLELLFRATPDLPPRLVGDPTRLRQVLVNLGSNAVKFTEAGEVTVGMEVASETAAEVELHVWVHDTGVGLSAAERARLFQPFVQADASTTRRFGGSGLGLSICRELVERMGGRLWVESEPGRGSTFHFTARFGRSDRVASPVSAAGSVRGGRALLVDDNAAAREVLGTMLEGFGVQVERLERGEAAIEAIERSAPGTYAWILLDWKMPGMDGVTCARRLLERDPADRPCILLVTAFAREDALRAAEGLALAGVLQKPVTPSSLHDCLVEARRGRPLPTARPLAAARPTALRARPEVAGARILVVEDNALNQELARELLERAGATVTLAADGAEAIERVLHGGPFDVVLMDCQMPLMDGYEATRRLRGLSVGAMLPIIAMTASALAEDRDRALAVGMNAHLTKPLDVERMLATIAEHRVRRAGPEMAAPSPATATAAPIDTDAGLARCLGQRDLYRRLLHGFQQTQSGFVAGYRHAIADGRADDAARALHDLTGLAGTIGAGTLQLLAGQLRAAGSGAERDAAFERMVPELERVLAQIRSLLRG